MMFWLDRACRLARPMPPTPTAAMLTRSLGAMRRVFPKPCTGRMANAVAAAAALRTNSRRGSVALAAFFWSIASPRYPWTLDVTDPAFESDAGDFKPAPEIANVFGHPFLGPGGAAVADGGQDAFLRVGDARARLRDFVDHRPERGHEQFDHRLVRQHEGAVVGGFTDRAEEFRALLDGGRGIELRTEASHDGFEQREVSRSTMARGCGRNRRLDRGHGLPHIVVRHVV